MVERLLTEIRGSHREPHRLVAAPEPWQSTEGTFKKIFCDAWTNIIQSSEYSDIRGPDDDGESPEATDDDLSRLMIQRSFSRDSSSTSDDSAYGSICRMDASKSMLDVFIERFVDAFSPEVDIKSGQAGAIRRAAEIRMFSPILSDAFDSVSQVFFGRSVQNKSIEVQGFSYYPRVLRSLQEALLDSERSKAESTLATVILLMAFEVLPQDCSLVDSSNTSTECRAYFSRISNRTRKWRRAFDRAPRPGKPYVWRRAPSIHRASSILGMS